MVLVEREASPSSTAVDADVSLSDMQLIEHFQETSDEQSFLTLIKRYQPTIRRFLYTILNGEENDDVKQEVLLALWQSLPRFSFRSSFLTYLYRICCNISYTYLRRNRRTQTTSEFDEQIRIDNDSPIQQHSSPTADEALQQGEHYSLVSQALQCLKTEDRLIIHLREFESRSVEECATILNCRSGTIKSQLHRAKKRLARVLQQEIPEGVNI